MSLTKKDKELLRSYINIAVDSELDWSFNNADSAEKKRIQRELTRMKKIVNKLELYKEEV